MFPLSTPPTPEEIETFRNKYKLTQKELEAKLNLGEDTIRQNESGRRKPSVLLTRALWHLEAELKEKSVGVG